MKPIPEEVFIGKKFGRLTPLERISVNGHRHYRCACDCGGEKTAQGVDIKRGVTTSCGCARKENTARLFRKHGKTDTPENRIWRGMRTRCSNPNLPAFRNYGGRGITVCEEWSDFEKFMSDMGPRPSPAHTLDRIDNDGPYCRANCRWATQTQQVRNRRITRTLTIEGMTKPLAEWAEVFGLDYMRFYDALRAQGWA